MKWDVEKRGEKVILPHFTERQPLSLRDTLMGGQCFRFAEEADGSFSGIIRDQALHVEMAEGNLIFHHTDIETVETQFIPYFDLNRDYVAIGEKLSRNPILRKAIAFAPGIRILRQDPWETLCSFLFSQNNHIPRICGIIERFCASFGTPLSLTSYAFPTLNQIFPLSAEDLAPIRCGYRAKSIVDAAHKVADGSVYLEALATLPLEKARAMLLQIHGVGPKVADCILLFGAGHIDAFPKDVWINRVMDSFFPKGLPRYALPYAGIAQQYLFHYVRFSPECASLRKK